MFSGWVVATATVLFVFNLHSLQMLISCFLVDLPDTSIADTSTEDADTSALEETPKDEPQTDVPEEIPKEENEDEPIPVEEEDKPDETEETVEEQVIRHEKPFKHCFNLFLCDFRRRSPLLLRKYLKTTRPPRKSPKMKTNPPKKSPKMRMSPPRSLFPCRRTVISSRR